MVEWPTFGTRSSIRPPSSAAAARSRRALSSARASTVATGTRGLRRSGLAKGGQDATARAPNTCFPYR
jgi:hypothetical protein